jgi:hypothetical protein
MVMRVALYDKQLVASVVVVLNERLQSVPVSKITYCTSFFADCCCYSACGTEAPTRMLVGEGGYSAVSSPLCVWLDEGLQ